MNTYADLTDAQEKRYSRHILLPEIGKEGQQKLLASRVLIVGAGGLGSPAGLYLAAAGIGTIGIADADIVDLTNLQRQIFHTTSNIGRPKSLSGAETMVSLNPDIDVVSYQKRLTADNALNIIANFDFVIDATDNFASKILIADTCYLAKKPYSYATVSCFDGQTMTVIPGVTTCYRCVFAEPPAQDAAPTHEQSGVLSTVPGVIGTIQATEAIKSILELGDLLTNRLLVYSALSMQCRSINVNHNPECALCGEMSSRQATVSPDNI
ncbi:MAG: ThiF family adenylyltransferase [Lentisphaerae bacterium]|nr:ThiF family adenylyltransferase [Lentisphaerota bacterium]